MKKLILKSAIVISIVALTFGLLNCKGIDSNSDSSRVSIDISGLLANLPVDSSSSSSSAQSSKVSGQIVSPPEDNDAQSAVKTLLLVPLTYVKHGEPYSTDNFDDDVEEDFEDDAVNSANYLQFIQLPTSKSTVEIEVPRISEGWQLLAAATEGKVESVDDIEDAVINYIGFTEQAFTDADGFNKANVTLELKRYCDQDTIADRPKGCATFDSDKVAIVTKAVEIQKVEINGDAHDGGYPLPWVVRDNTAGDEVSVSDAESYMEAARDEWVALNTGEAITNITVSVTHQKSSGASGACSTTPASASPATFDTNCDGYQTYSRDY